MVVDDTDVTMPLLPKSREIDRWEQLAITSSQLFKITVDIAVPVRPNIAHAVCIVHQCVGFCSVKINTQRSKTFVGPWPNWPKRFPRPCIV